MTTLKGDTIELDGLQNMSSIKVPLYISTCSNFHFYRMNFSRDHFTTLIKYIGISFITGAISHGVFSGTRSLLTGAFGVACFII